MGAFCTICGEGATTRTVYALGRSPSESVRQGKPYTRNERRSGKANLYEACATLVDDGGNSRSDFDCLRIDDEGGPGQGP